MIKKFLLTLLLILTFSCNAVFASIANPQFDGFVADEAGMLNPEMVKNLNKSFKDIKKKTGVTVAVVILNNIGEQSIDDVGKEIVKNIKVTEPRKDNSIIFLMTDKEKLLHVILGREINEFVKSEEFEKVIKADVVPELQRGALDSAFINGANSIINFVPNGANSFMILYGSIPAYGEHKTFNWLWLLLLPAFGIVGLAGWYFGKRSSKS